MLLTVLPKAMRLTRAADFAVVLKSGRRVGARHLAVHVLAATGLPTQPGAHAASPVVLASVRSARAGLVVSSKVGNSVVRHRVTRRLREQLRPLLERLPVGTDVVVRAFPAAADASSAQLSADLRFALGKLTPAELSRS